MNQKQCFFLLIAICALLVLTGCSSSMERNYQSGEELLAQEKFEEAAAKFQELGSYEDASLLLMYCRAAAAAERGDYDSAEQAFTVLGEFQDAPQMLRYYEGREAESEGLAALNAEDFESAVRLLTGAAEGYSTLSSFRDAASRASSCLGTLYDRGSTLLSAGRYGTAQAIFSALGAWGDSSSLADYCEASLLDGEGSYLDASRLFAKIPSTLDAGARAEADRERVYQQALSLSAEGEQEAAVTLLSSLGSFRDAEAQKLDITRRSIGERLRTGDYEGALFLLDAAPDAVTLQSVSAAERERFSSFLDGFVEAYLHFSAGTMDSVSGYYGVLPYIEQGGALDMRFRQVLMIGDYSHNSYFQYYGSELLDVLAMEENCYLAYIRASASANQPVGPVYVTRTFRIIVKDTEAGLIAGSIEDCLYGTDTSASGRPVVSGPLPNDELPEDEDGDGIILVDVMKKGFQGTMIIVLDPSRVFAGGPGFYGGNGMLLEDLVRRYDALGGINGGGFIDEDGGGSGGLPEGLTIVDGQSYHYAGSGASAAFDEDNVLHVGFYTIEAAAEARIRDCVSFGPALIVDGVGEYGAYMETGINPRTAIGQRKDGAVLMLCIDGRQIHSIGASFGDLRDVMLDFGAVNACSLDGGSSTVMYYDGQYINSSSSASGTSRYLPNAFLIRK